MFGSGIVGSFNDDVLNARPSSPEDALKLIDEIKSRAKASIGTRNYPEAIRLYTKAIEVCPCNDTNAKSILLSNRSMCFLNMGNKDHALQDAEEAIAVDPTYPKGHYRKASALIALENYAVAEETLLDGLSLKPDDKDFKALLVLSRSKQTKVKSTAESKESNASLPSKGAQSVKNTSSVPDKKPQQPNSEEKADDELELGASETFRGYKKTKDGKVTTFFNRDLDEATKALIGNIAPKKIDPPAQPTSERSTNVGSVWNSAGTFESIDHSKCNFCFVLVAYSDKVHSIKI
jgi:tetratricopeptide (TPR) repeat protein